MATRKFRKELYKIASKPLPKEMLKRIISMKDMYEKPLTRKYRSLKNFRDLFYSDKTPEAVRVYMLYNGLYQEQDKSGDTLKYSSALRQKWGSNIHYEIAINRNKDDIPIGFYLQVRGPSSKKYRAERVPIDHDVRRALRNMTIDDETAKITAMALSKKIDTARGLKMAEAMFQIMRWINLVKLHLEATVYLHCKDDDHFFSSPKEWPEEEYMDFYLDDQGWRAEGFVDHCNHYLSEQEKIALFVWVVRCENEMNLFLQQYIDTKNFVESWEGIILDYKSMRSIDKQLCTRIAMCLKRLADLHLKLMASKIHVGISRKRLSKVRPTHKIPQIVSHETRASWRIPNAVGVRSEYSVDMKKLKKKLEIWKNKGGLPSDYE